MAVVSLGGPRFTYVPVVGKVHFKTILVNCKKWGSGVVVFNMFDNTHDCMCGALYGSRVSSLHRR